MDSHKIFYRTFQNQLRLNALFMFEIEEIINHIKTLEKAKTKLKTNDIVKAERIDAFKERIRKEKRQPSSFSHEKLNQSFFTLSNALCFILQTNKTGSKNIGASDLSLPRHISIERDYYYNSIVIEKGSYTGLFNESLILELYYKLIKIVNFCYINLSRLFSNNIALLDQIGKAKLYHLSKLNNGIQVDTMCAKGFIYQKINESKINTKSVQGSTEKRAKKITNLAEFIKHKAILTNSGYNISKKEMEIYFAKKELPTSYAAKKKYLIDAEKILGPPIVVKK